jgi:hypothetical protein
MLLRGREILRVKGGWKWLKIMSSGGILYMVIYSEDAPI